MNQTEEELEEFFFVKIMAIWSKFWGIFMDFGKILKKIWVAKIKKRADSGCPKLPARFLKTNFAKLPEMPNNTF